MILPWSSSIPGSELTFWLKVRWCERGSTEATLSGSATSTGNPGTIRPLGCHAYTWRSSPATTMSSLREPSSDASTGEERKPCSVRSRGPWRTVRSGDSGKSWTQLGAKNGLPRLRFIVSSLVATRFGIYAALRVPEVWRLEGDALTFHVLAADGKYTVTANSLSFPLVTPADLMTFLRPAREAGDQNPVIQQFREWIRQRRTANGGA